MTPSIHDLSMQNPNQCQKKMAFHFHQPQGSLGTILSHVFKIGKSSIPQHPPRLYKHLFMDSDSQIHIPFLLVFLKSLSLCLFLALSSQARKPISTIHIQLPH